MGYGELVFSECKTLSPEALADLAGPQAALEAVVEWFGARHEVVRAEYQAASDEFRLRQASRPDGAVMLAWRDTSIAGFPIVRLEVVMVQIGDARAVAYNPISESALPAFNVVSTELLDVLTPLSDLGIKKWRRKARIAAEVRAYREENADHFARLAEANRVALEEKRASQRAAWRAKEAAKKTKKYVLAVGKGEATEYVAFIEANSPSEAYAKARKHGGDVRPVAPSYQRADKVEALERRLREQG